MEHTHIFYVRLLPLFAFLLISSFSLSAQIVLSTDDADNGEKTVSCSSSTTFLDDGSTDGLYFDDQARTNTITICPNQEGRQIKVTFMEFSVASGDWLEVFDGDDTSDPSLGQASGSGASAAFGSWVQANCDPAVNPTGCLTFQFVTNGDRQKGNGWRASITCENSAVAVQCPADILVTDDCNSLDGMVQVTIPKPVFSVCDGAAFSMVELTSSCSAITGGTVLADGGTLGTFTIPLGTYSITATSIADNSKKCTYYVFADQPGLTCNDRVTNTIGTGCQARVTVDDVLERPCFGSGTTYTIEVDLGGKNGKKSATVDGSSQSSINNDGLDLDTDDFECGKYYSVKITRTISFTGCGSGNSVSKSCTGQIRFVDNSAPSIFLNAPTLVTCGELSEEEVLELLDVHTSDNCEVENTDISIGRFPSNFCSSNLNLPVTITATDYCGNTTKETFEVVIQRPTSFYLPADTTLTCGAGTDPEVTGYPVLDTDGDGKGDLPIIDNTCNFIPIYDDRVVSANNSSTIKVYRTWQIKDWCNQATPVKLGDQLIQLKDTGKPELDCPAANERGGVNRPYQIYTNSDCNADVNLTPPTASDNCSDEVEVVFQKAVDVDSEESFNNLDNLPIGAYYAEYRAEDAAGNRSDLCKVYFNVTDGQAPSAICADQLNVSFVNGIATISAADVDGGSTDACSQLTRAIRKEGGSWGNTVQITCAEAAADVKVYFRVTDASGAENTCWTLVRAEQKTVGQCTTLADRTISCEDFSAADFGNTTDTNENGEFDAEEWAGMTAGLASFYNEQFGEPDCGNASDCGAPAIEQQYQLIPKNCGQTLIQRRYRAVGENATSDWKNQTITLETNEAYSIEFPADWSGNCGDQIPEAGLSLTYDGCTILAWEHTDRTFAGDNDACLLVERTYLVTNWCYHEAGQEPVMLTRMEDEHGASNGLTVTEADVQGLGLFGYVQVLEIEDDTPPTVTLSEVTACLSDCEDAKTFSATASDCLGTEGLTFSYELMSDGSIIASGTEDRFTATVRSGDYALNWTVSDNCGNTTTETANYTFRACVRPSVFCKDGVATTINESGVAQVWAIDLDGKSTDACHAEELAFRVWHPIVADQIAQPAGDADAATILSLPENVDLTCDYLGQQTVSLYVVDAAGNWDVCNASVQVQDTRGHCGSGLVDTTNTARISGGIISMKGEPLAGVEVAASGTVFYQKSTTTSDIGVFEMDLPKGIGYQLQFHLDGDAAAGITVSDIIIVAQHILGIQPFENDYQKMAADINLSGEVTTFDIVAMRRLILGLQTDLGAGNPVWRFAAANDAETTSGETANTRWINLLEEDKAALDFVAAKAGDLNSSAIINGLQPAISRQAPMFVELPDQQLQKGEFINIELNLENTDGYQLALDLSRFELKNKLPDGVILQNNQLKICRDRWSNADFDKTLSLQLRAQKDGALSELLALSSDMEALAVDKTGQARDLRLYFTSPPVLDFEGTIYPNPLQQEATLEISIPENSRATLQIYSTQGQLLQQQAWNLEKGKHQLPVHLNLSQNAGILYYQLLTDFGKKEGKLVRL